MKICMPSCRRKLISDINPRNGLTLVELLVVISIISVLMALILPAVQNARRSARRVECLNHLKNLSIAMTGYATTQKRYPAAGYWAGVPGSRYPSHNWCVNLLSYVDHRDLADRWDYATSSTDAPNGHFGLTQVAVFVCPEDDSTMGAGDLSYGVSGGIGYSTYLNNVHDVPLDPFGNAIDLNGNGIIGLANDSLDGHPSDRTLLKNLGLFFMENFGAQGGVVRHYTQDSVTDGFSNTLMLIENMRTGRIPPRSKKPGRHRTLINRRSFTVPKSAKPMCARQVLLTIFVRTRASGKSTRALCCRKDSLRSRPAVMLVESTWRLRTAVFTFWRKKLMALSTQPCSARRAML